jgi:hypothetical protein
MADPMPAPIFGQPIAGLPTSHPRNQPRPLPPGPPPTTPELRDAARQAAVQHTVKGVFVFASLAAGAGALVYPRNKPVGDFIIRDVSGFEPDPVPGSKRANIKLGAVSVFGLAPIPIGFVPPEAYGLSPDFLLTQRKRRLSDPANDPGIIIIGAMGGNPGGPRQDYFNAKLADETAALYRTAVKTRTTETLLGDYANPSLAIGLYEFDGYRLQRDPEIRAIAAAELQRRGVPLPALEPWQGEAIADGTVVPSAIKPVNDAAIANGEAAEGIRKQLVSEIADP